jgi:lipopolysaccharide export system permease protein
MWILSRYVLRAHFGPFVFALGTLTGLLLVNQVARRFEELAGKGLDIGTVAEVFVLSLPHIIALTLPMAVLVAVLYAFSQLAAENEVTALKSSGINLVRLLVPLLVVAAGLTATMVWFNDRVLPETNHQLKNLLMDIGRKTPMLELKEQVINELPSENQRTRYFLKAAKIEAASNRLWDVVIYDLSDPNRTRTVFADSGQMGFNQEQTDLFMVLFTGQLQEVEPHKPETFQRMFFQEQRLRIPGVGSQFERTFETGFRSDREMSIGMLAAEVRDARRQLDEVRAEAEAYALSAVREALGQEAPAPDGDVSYQRLAPGPAPGDATVIAQAGLPSIAQFPSIPGAMGGDDLLTRRTAVELRSLQYRAELYQFRINSYAVEYHKKYAIPFACMVFVLIGAPLAVRFPRGGAGMVIAISLSVFALYYAALIGGENLGDKGTVSPAWAMWAPNVLLLILGLVGLARMSRFSSTSRGGGWGDLFGSLRSALLWPVRTLRGARS